MYEAFFHLREKPFDIVPNPAYLYLSRTHRQALTSVRYGLLEQKGFVLMTGEVGAGKTTLVRELMRTMGPEVTFARIFNTRVSSRELIEMINHDFGLETAVQGKVAMLRDLNTFLISEYQEGRKAVLIIDEAQNLSRDQLEEVRMLSNLETDDAKLLQILLVGQPELKRVLSLAELRQLRQRISIACHLQSLDRQETELYILHRLSVAGNRAALSFASGALDRLHKVTDGIPRQINRLCDFLLLTAYAEERSDISEEMVKEIAENIGIESSEEAEQATAGANRRPPGGDAKGSEGKRALLRALGVQMPERMDTAPASGGTWSLAEPNGGSFPGRGGYPPETE